ncbi:MAG TPA: hypothetical protein VI306_07300 [Pyrinomonadaceae bacterium]
MRFSEAALILLDLQSCVEIGSDPAKESWQHAATLKAFRLEAQG